MNHAFGPNGGANFCENCGAARWAISSAASSCPGPIPVEAPLVPEDELKPKIVQLVPRKQHVEAEGMQENLKILDNLRTDLLTGKIVAISGVCITTDDATFSFSCIVGRVSKLRTTGALAWALQMFMRRCEQEQEQEQERSK